MRICLAVLALAACSDSASPAPDAAVYDTERCLIAGNFGALGALTGAVTNPNGSTAVTITLDAGPPRDTFFLRMDPNEGAFSGGIAPGTFAISGVDAGYATCGLCVHVIADIVAGSGPSKFYFADSGTVTLTSVTPPIAGSAQDLHFAEVDINSGQKVTGGCEATIDSISFSTP